MKDILISLENSKLSSFQVVEKLYLELQTRYIQIIEYNNAQAIARINNTNVIKFSSVLSQISFGQLIVQEILHHSAALLQWLSYPHTVPIVIIHVDSHNDLRSPNLIKKSSIIIDRWTRKPVYPNILESVKNAIDSTSIEIGSFLTLALYWLPVKALIWIYPDTVEPVIKGCKNPATVNVGWNVTDEFDFKYKRLCVSPLYSLKYGIPIYICEKDWQIFDAIKKTYFWEIIF